MIILITDTAQTTVNFIISSWQ